MPLRDHFRPPLSEIASGEGVHGQWPAVIVQQLVKTLPARYVAAPRVHLGSQIEIEIATFDQQDTRSNEIKANQSETEQSAVATAVWAPTEPTLTLETEMADFDEYEVRVFDVRRSRRLVAAIELVSPENKDRDESRRQFVAKCAALLREGVSVVVVDLVTMRTTNLYVELLQLIGERDPVLGDEPPNTYAAACRWRPRGASRCLEVWNQSLILSQPLPCLPLWLTEDLAIPLDLEASYEQTCRNLRIV